MSKPALLKEELMPAYEEMALSQGMILLPFNELACEDNIPIETEQHKLQMELLIDSLRLWLNKLPNGYVGGNMFIHYLTPKGHKAFKGLDVIVVLDVPKGIRDNWIVWKEGKGPDVVIELLSKSTIGEDKNKKKEVYQNQLFVKEYFWFDPKKPVDFSGFTLQHGIYQTISANNEGHLISQILGLKLVQWKGFYKNAETTWLQWETLEGDLLPTPEEAEQKRAERLAEKLRRG
ncbi:Uma2 family endonuclease [Candidatus Parabeggiatoa sp. HSG14]|uniref:Uma2 family endonuclease n=1 Tax=Candidatus Parabeggiatoa sp. HSG14 TaxID=3055593 RepID=UPI0025A7E474|nr:Uma2 family endonuclease [Thiotrichales bacterium HSG14]